MHFEGLEKNKQEWSFTLYDFDGHGKITREVNSNKVESVTPCSDIQYHAESTLVTCLFKQSSL